MTFPFVFWRITAEASLGVDPTLAPVLRCCIRNTRGLIIPQHHFNNGSNYDSLIVRTVAFPVQVAYWI